MNGRTPLEVVAGHEQGLMQRVAEVEGEAQRLIDAARAQAAVLRREEGERLNSDIASRRADAAVMRTRLVEAVEAKAATEVARIRQDASARIPAVQSELAKMILPSGKEGLAQ